MASKKSINLFLGLDSRQFQKGINKAQKSLSKFGNRAKRAGKSMSTSLTAPLLGIAAVAGKTFMDFEQAMLKVKAISGATGQQFKALEADAKRLGSTTMFTASQVAGLQLELSKLGLTPEEINNSTESILALAQATDSDLAQSATVAAKTMQAFGMEASDMTKIADIMADSFSSSALDMAKFETAMSSVAPVAKQAGADLEQTTAILGVLVNNGVEASTAGTALRNIFLDLAKEGMTMGEAMDQINNSTNPLATSMEMFGKRGATVATILANNGQAIQDLTDDFRDSEGEAKSMAEIMDSGLGGSMRKLQSQLEGVGIQLGEILLPIFQKVIGFISKGASAFSNLSSEQQGLIVAAGAAAAAIGPLLTLLGTIGSVLAAALSPVGLVVAAVVGAAILIYKNWEPVKKTLVQVINYFIDLYNESTLIRVIAEAIALRFKLAVAAIKFFVKAGIALIKSFASNFTSLFGGIGNIIKGVFTLDIDTLAKGLDEAKEALASTFDPSKNKDLLAAGEELGETTAEAIAKGIDNIKGKNPIKYITEDDIQGAVDGAQDMAQSVMDKITGFFGSSGGGGTTTTTTTDPSGPMMGPPEPDPNYFKSFEDQQKGFFDKSEDEWSEWASTAEGKLSEFQNTYGQVFGQLGDILTQHTNNQKEKLNQETAAQLENLQLQHEQELEAIENSVMSEEAKNQALEDAETNYATNKGAIEEKAAKEHAKLARRQAKIDKATAALGIVVNTASAVIAAVAASPLTGGLPWSAIIAGLGAVQLGTVLAAPLPALAEGGLAFGETAAIVGDNPGANVDPEVIAPLSKLKSMMGGQEVIVTGRISGEDIFLSNERYNKRLNSFS